MGIQLNRLLNLEVALACLSILAFSSLGDQSDILPNGSFEQETTDKGKSTPRGWWFPHAAGTTYTGVYVQDDKSSIHSGKRAVCVVGNETTPPNGTSAMWLSGPIDVKPGAAYAVTGWIKTSGCSGKGAWLWITAAEDQNGKHGDVVGGETLFFTGTEEWRESSMQIYIPRNIRRLRIACRLDGPGTASFDDVSVSRIEQE